jgi:hypothetical protein
LATFTVFALEAAAPLSVPAAGVGSGGGSAPPAAPVTGQPVSGTAAREPIRWWVAVGALVVFAVAAIVAWF